MHEQYYNIREMLFKLKDLQLTNATPSAYSPRSYLTEHGTLQMYFGRQTGSTYWLKDKISSLDSRDYIALFQNNRSCLRLPNCFSVYYWLKSRPISNCKYFFIDTHMFLEPGHLNKIFDTLYFMPDLRFVTLL